MVLLTHNVFVSYYSGLHSPKCDGFMVASNRTDRILGTVDIPHEGPEEYNNIWQKVRSMWSYVYDNYYEKYDWYVAIVVKGFHCVHQFFLTSFPLTSFLLGSISGETISIYSLKTFAIMSKAKKSRQLRMEEFIYQMVTKQSKHHFLWADALRTKVI